MERKKGLFGSDQLLLFFALDNVNVYYIILYYIGDDGLVFFFLLLVKWMDNWICVV